MLRGRGSSSHTSHPRMSCSAWAGWGAPNRAGLPHSTLAQTQRQEQTGSTPGPVCAPSKRRGGRPPALVLQKRTAQSSSGLAGEALKVPPAGSHCASPDPPQAHPCTGSPSGESEKRARWGQEGFRISLLFPSFYLSLPLPPSTFRAASKLWGSLGASGSKG